jgi:sugar lactone lactonase YvrE
VKGFASPSGVALEKSDAYMWVADQQANKLYRVQIKTGKIVDTITKPGYKSLAGVATVPADH